MSKTDHGAAVEYVHSSATDLPVGITDKRTMTIGKKIALAIVAIIAAVAWGILAFSRGENINAVWLVMAAVGSYIIAFTTYARYIEMTVVRPRADRATPAEYDNDGKDFMPTDRRVLFGHHSPRSPALVRWLALFWQPDGLPAGHAVDHHRRDLRRCGSGLPDPMDLHSSSRPFPGRDAQG